MAIRSASTIDCELPGGGTVQIRVNLPVQACCVRLLQQARQMLADIAEDEQGYLTGQAMYLAERIGELVAVGAIVGWKGLLDEDGNAVPYHPRAVERLDLMDALAVVTEIVGNLRLESALVQAAAESGAPDPTMPDPESVSGGS
jgi:hypothetical protein